MSNENGKNDPMEEEGVERHESYGMVGITRMTSNGAMPLFGSNLPEHPTVISLVVRPAERHFSLGRSWFYAKSQPLIEVQLSPHQYAEMLSNPNVGHGVPCTITSLNGKRMARPPVQKTTASRIRETFGASMRDMADQARKGAEAINKVLSESKLSVRAKDEIKNAYFAATRFLTQENYDFALTSFNEAMQKTVVEAKQEVDAFIMHAVHETGIDALKQLALGAGTTSPQEPTTIDVKPSTSTVRLTGDID